jgi:hypothetical protein
LSALPVPWLRRYICAVAIRSFSSTKAVGRRSTVGATTKSPSTSARARGNLPVLSLEDAAEQAHELLRRRDTWGSVQRVAAELIRFKELGYDDLKFLIH